MMEVHEKDGANQWTKTRKKSGGGDHCCAVGCTNHRGKNAESSFHRIPAKQSLRAKWLGKISRKNFTPTDSTRLCNLHFVGQRGPSKDHPIPTIFQHKPQQNVSSRRVLERKAAATPTVADAAVNPPVAAYETVTGVIDSCETYTSFEQPPEPATVAFHKEPSVDHSYSLCEDTNMTERDDDHDIIMSLEEKCKKLTEELASVKSVIGQQVPFSFEDIRNDDKLVNLYTGLNNASVCMSVFEYLEPRARNLNYWRGGSATSSSEETTSNRCKPGPKRKLQLIDEFFLVLCKLRGGFPNEDLANRFMISDSTVSKIFVTWINFLFRELYPLLVWPSREKVISTMPSSFKEKYPSTRTIIDCTEIYIERPSSLVAQSQTYSSYKSHNTFKALVAISPSGAITFVSKLYGGHCSDRYITENCGLIRGDWFEYGDSLMADRGFNIQDLLVPFGVHLNIPPFLHGRTQFSKADALKTKKIAAVRIHVERAIRRVKEYRILNSVLPITMAPVADQIFTVCCVLSNFQSALL